MIQDIQLIWISLAVNKGLIGLMCRLVRLLPQAALHFWFDKVHNAHLTRTGSP